jgi:aminomethyltransferase
VHGVISRTGYTGEDGFELYIPAASGMELWQALMRAGEPLGLIATGLGCRDSLRLEMGYALYGNDLDEEHTPLESGLGWITKLDKGDFIGRDALVQQKESGVTRRLVGMKLTEKGFPRHGYPIASGDQDVGVVTSGVVSPSLGVGVAMGYVPTEMASGGTEVGVRIRKNVVPAIVQRPPFYTEGSVRR